MQERIESIVKEACAKAGVALYDLEMKATAHGRVLVVFVTSLGGVKVKYCQRVSRLIEHQLEEEDIIDGRYFLEVSSPGLERELKKKSHFVSAIGEQVSLSVQTGDGNSPVSGRLHEVNPDSITLKLADDEMLEISLSRIKKAKTLFDYKKDLKKKPEHEDKIKEK
jgi:ribosome maturation factor RimP